MKIKLQLRQIVKMMLAVPLFLMMWSTGGAQHQVTGTVVDDNTSDPIPGASILVLGTERGTSTNIEGNFELNVPDENSTLVVSFVGYEQQEIQIDGRTDIEIRLEPSILYTEDVVVVGYGIQERASITGSVAVVDPERLQRRATPSIEQALQGQASGVHVQSSGHPGAAPNIQIRGVATFGNNRPLYVIDGVPVDNIQDFNMRDVESIQILKDASAAAVYGSRAANGVVIITTKQGERGAFSINYEVYGARQDIPRSRWYDVTNREQYQELNNRARANVGLAPYAGNDPNSPLFVDDIDTDWQEESFRPGYMQDHNLTVSGGTETSRYSITGNLLDQEGTMRGPGPNYERRSIRVNSDHTINRFRVGQSLFYSSSSQAVQRTEHLNSLIENIVRSIPTYPVFDDSRRGGFGGTESNIHNAIMLNPVGQNHLFEGQNDRGRFLGNIWGEMDLVENLVFRINYSYDKAEFRNFEFTPQYDLGYFFINDVATLAEERGELTRNLVELTLNYQESFGMHSFDVLAGYSEERNNFETIRGTAEGYTEPYFKVLDAGPDDRSSTGFRSGHNLRSFFGRVNYNFDERYLLSATVRRDGSSRFSPDNRFGTFPSVSVGWRVSNEDFFDVEFINDLRIRASYGEVGNQDLGDYDYAAFINTNAHYVFDGNPALGAIQTTLANPNVRWETNVSSGIGIDMELFDERLLFSADYYRNESHDILLGVPIPNHVGAIGSPTVNAANFRNTGFEFSLTYRDFVGDLRYNIGGNISTINNEVLSLGEAGEPIFGYHSRTAVGSEMGELYGFVIEGIFQDQQEIDELNAKAPSGFYQEPGTAPGDFRYADLSGDGEVSAENDRTYLGSVFPDFYFGMNADFNFRNWDLAMNFTGSYGNKIVNGVRRTLEWGHEAQNYTTRMIDESWTPDNPDASLPRLAFGDPNDNNRDSERWIEDGSFLRLQNLQIGYTLPTSLTEQIGVNTLRFYASGQNLFIITNYSGMDPEIGPGGENNDANTTTSRGVDNGSWPNPRVLSLGLQVSI